MEKLWIEARVLQGQMEGLLRQMYQLSQQYAVVAQLPLAKEVLFKLDSAVWRLEEIAKEVDAIEKEDHERAMAEAEERLNADS